MSIDHEADRQVGYFSNFRQQLFRWTNIDKRIYNKHSPTAHDKTGIAACLAAVRTDGRINSLANVLDREIRSIGGKCTQRKPGDTYQNRSQFAYHGKRS